MNQNKPTWIDELTALDEAAVEGWLQARRARITPEALAELKARAESLSERGDLAAALRLLQRGMRAAEIRADPRLAALLWRGYANVYVRHARYAECLHASEQAATLYAQHGTASDVAVARLVGIYALGALERFDEAVRQGHAVREALAQETDERARLGLAHVAANLGAVHTQAHHFDDARRELQTARRLYAHLNLPDQVAWVLHDLAVLELQAGHLRRAEAHFEAAEAGLEASDYRLVHIRLKFNQADAYIHAGRYRQALDALRVAREQIAAIPSTLDEERGYVASIEARVYEALNEPATATERYRRALAVFEAAGSKIDTALIQVDLGRCLLAGQTPEHKASGFEALMQAQRRIEQAGVPLLQAQVQLVIAECHLNQGMGEAAEYAQRAREAFTRAGLTLHAARAGLVLADARQRLDPEAARRLYRESLAAVEDVPPLAARTWAGLARLAEQQDEPEAEAAYIRAITHLEEMQHGLRQHGQRARFFEKQSALVEAFLALYHRQPGRERDLLRWVERGKARALAGLLAGQEADESSTTALRSLWKQRNQLRGQLDRQLSALTMDETGAFATWKEHGEAWLDQNRQAHLASLRQAIRRLDQRITRHRDPATRWREGESMGLDDIHRLLDAETAMVFYYQSTGGLNALTVTHVPGDIQRHRLPMCLREIASHWRRTRRYATRPRSALPAAQRQLGTLWQALVKPLAARLCDKSRVIVLPHRALFEIPFAALYDEARTQYLAERWTVQIAPSATALRLCRQRQRATRPPLLVGYPGDPAAAYHLPGVEREVREAHAMFTGATMLLGEEATAPNVLETAPGRAAVLLAGHTIYDAETPLESGVALARQTWLRAADLYVRHGYLAGSTVVLSGCEAGRGKAIGDDVMGLNSAFLYAGAVGVVAGLWRVHDAATTHLTRAFFTAWCEGQDTAAALQTAQRRLLRDPQLCHPATWAAFQVFGATTTLPK